MGNGTHSNRELRQQLIDQRKVHEKETQELIATNNKTVLEAGKHLKAKNETTAELAEARKELGTIQKERIADLKEVNKKENIITSLKVEIAELQADIAVSYEKIKRRNDEITRIKSTWWYKVIGFFGLK